MEFHLPSAPEVLREYFGDGGPCEHSEVRDERENLGPFRDFSDQNVDTSLFPYRVEGPCDPPIPTPAEIAAARPDKLHSFESVWRVGSYMVKVGHYILIMQEAENLLYLEKNSTVRTPKVYAAFASRDANPYKLDYKEGDEYLDAYYIVMEYIDGAMLGDVAEELENNVQLTSKVGQLLGEQMKRLRSVPPEDSTHFGRVGGKAYTNHMSPFYYPPAPNFLDFGPFNYEGCVKRLIHSAKVDTARTFSSEGDYPPLTRLLFRDATSALLDHAGPSDRLPVLSHLDTQPHNIMVKLVRDDKGEAVDVEEVVLIDWETLAWMPSWYEAGDIAHNMTVQVDFYRDVFSEVFPVMGHVNTVIAAYLSMCVNRAFFLIHL